MKTSKAKQKPQTPVRSTRLVRRREYVLADSDGTMLMFARGWSKNLESAMKFPSAQAAWAYGKRRGVWPEHFRCVLIKPNDQAHA